jgi:hypothetical protein
MLAGDAEVGEEYVAGDPYTRYLIVHQRLETTHTLSQGSAPLSPRELRRSRWGWSSG